MTPFSNSSPLQLLHSEPGAADGPALRSQMRRLVFLYQDGVVLAATLRALNALGFPTDCGALGQWVEDQCQGLSSGAFAHVQIGLRTLAQAGWLATTPGTSGSAELGWTADGRQILSNLEPYLVAGDFLAHFHGSEADSWARSWPAEATALFDDLVARADRGWFSTDLDPGVRALATTQIEGALLTPLLCSLRALDRLHDDRPELDPSAAGERQHALLQRAGWLCRAGAWTPLGQVGLRYVPHLGLSASYLPLFAQLPDLYRGAPPGPVLVADPGRERHVQRELNIAASTAAHGRYFADADEMIARIFDGEPLSRQPRAVIDVGCGDGSWLARVARLVRTRTRRGRHLADHPLVFVGADHSAEALERARENLAGEDAAMLLIAGDITEPEALAATLAGHSVDMADALHLHAFIHHDRRYRSGPGGGGATSLDRGLYLDADGQALTPAEVEEDLAAHLAQWAPFARRHGLVVLEAHRVPPLLAAREQGALHSIAFDAYHAYSRQYPIERSGYQSALRRAGLREAASEGRCYPSSRAVAAVSLSRLLCDSGQDILPRAAPTSPGPEREDGQALHRLLYHDGDVQYPRPWCAPATRRLVAEAMAFLEERLERTSRPVLRICDYGTGTGLAAIELLKAYSERGLSERLEQKGVRLELHLVDIPSPWFAQGQALLQSSPGVTFHALTDKRGRFRTLSDLVGGGGMDLVLASMVFHLVPTAALTRVANNLADILSPGGALLWNAPDLGPAAAGTILFHDPNRMLRRNWEALLRGEAPQGEAQTEAVARARRAADGTIGIQADRAGRRVLPTPNHVDAVAASFSGRFRGDIASRPHEMTAAESLDAILVPSNNRELLPEIEDDGLRRAVVEEMMGRLLPAFCHGPAGTGAGFAVHWTHGSHRLL